MPFKLINKALGGALVASLCITMSASRSQAVGLDEVIIGILDCVTGALDCGNTKQKQQPTIKPPKPITKPTTKRTAPRSTISSAQRQQNRQVQTALNGFGWNVGSVDGVLGRRSKAAIGDYQRHMGYPATGQLSDRERRNLIDSWQKYQDGVGASYPRTMAAEGPRGMLNIGRDPNYASRYGDLGGAGTVPPLEPERPGQVAVSAADRCGVVDNITSIQGRTIHAANMTDPNQALSEKFCEAREFAITQGGSVAAQYEVSENEMTERCGQIQGGLTSAMPRLTTQSQDRILPTLQTAVSRMGLNDAATMGAYGQICLGIGYRLDNAEMALAGAMVLLAAGQSPYGELVGHHLREGFGVQANADSAVPWYLNAMDALEGGATPVFFPSTTPERIQVIRAALQVEGQRANSNSQMLPKVVPVSATLPALTPKN